MATDTQALSAAWQNAEKSGDYSQIAGLLGDMTGQQLMSVYGLAPADLNYINEKAGTALMPISGSALSSAAAATNSPAALDAQIAQDLMQRSMTTGVPTSEFDKYGGYDKVASLYNGNNGTYSLEQLDPKFLDAVDNTIANTGVGNLSVLKMTGEPLTKAGYQNMLNNGVSMTEADLKAFGIPYEGFLQVPKKTTTTQGSGTGGTAQLDTGPRVMGPLPGAGAESGFNTWRAGAAGNDMLGAGNADYHSELLKSLRQSSITPYSNNAGVQFMQNRGGSSTNSTPAGAQAMAFNPQVLSPRTATPQEVADWNAYSAYRTNALNSKTPMLSMAEWLANGKSDGKPVTPEITPEVANWSGY